MDLLSILSLCVFVFVIADVILFQLMYNMWGLILGCFEDPRLEMLTDKQNFNL